jgi:fatty-acyl-CoA synthase
MSQTNPANAETDFVAYHAGATRDRVACVALTSNETLTYGQLDVLIARCTGWLEAQLKPAAGKRVAILARNGIDILVLHFACVRSGAILQPLNWRLTGPELAALIADAEPEIFVYESEFADAAKIAMEGSSIRETFVIAPGENQFRAVVEASAPSPGRPMPTDAPITLLYTSGTTGRSKGVIVTRMNAWCCAMNFSWGNEVAPRDVLLCDMPMFHVAGLFGVSRSALFMGATVLISDRFTPREALARMSDPKLGVTHYFAVPQMAAAMFNDPTYKPSMLQELKALVIGGAPLPIPTIERLLADRVRCIEGYGSSEAGTVFGMPLDLETIARKKGSCGTRALHTIARIVDADGNDAKPNEVGEIWLKGPAVTPGYWNQPERTAKGFSPDGWFKTGDAARCDEDGFFYIVDRWKDMYISGGENVYPAEVESALAAHPGIVDAAIVGVPDPQWGEVGAAIVVTRAGTKLTPDEVIAHCRSRLAGYKTPRHVRFVESLPRTASGKIRKDLLRRDFAQGDK